MELLVCHRMSWNGLLWEFVVGCRRSDGIIPTACATSSLWLMSMGCELSASQLAALFGHQDSKFGGQTEAGVLGLLGNSMHLCEAWIYKGTAGSIKVRLHS